MIHSIIQKCADFRAKPTQYLILLAIIITIITIASIYCLVCVKHCNKYLTYVLIKDT